MMMSTNHFDHTMMLQPAALQSGTVSFTSDTLLRNARIVDYVGDHIAVWGPYSFPVMESPSISLYPIDDIEQNWYWTSEWQAEERQSIEDYDSGRYQEFSSMDDFIDSLDAPDR